MIDNRTTNKNYPLPHPSNIASQDVERIAIAISSIDSDIAACSSNVDALDSGIQELDSKALRIPANLVGTVDTELHDIAPRKYLVVNDTATGFSTVEGGGGEGGKTGEILVKKSDENFDTTWMDPRAILKKAPTVKEITSNATLGNNSINILADAAETDSNDLIPRAGLTQRQVTGDTIGDPAYTYIIGDSIDNTLEDTSDLATSTKFGRVKIGTGINVNNGAISVPIIGNASTSNFGVVKIGNGLTVNDGVVSAQTYPHADTENFGIVKPGNDFTFGSDGSLQLANKSPDIIYQKKNVNAIENGVIQVVSTCCYYRAYISTDTLFSFDWSQIDQTNDIAFDVEIVADDAYVVNFGNNITWLTPCTVATNGSTVIHFEKMLGTNFVVGNLVSVEAPPEIVSLVDGLGDDISNVCICRHNGTRNNPKVAYRCNKDEGGEGAFYLSNPTEPFYEIDFFKSTYIDEIGIVREWDSAPYFNVEGSIDGKNWIRLLSLTNFLTTGDYTLTKHGFYRYYRILTTGIRIKALYWRGYSVEDEVFELEKLIPVMTAASENGYEITSSGLNSGALYNLTTASCSTYADFNTRLNGEYWIKYELPVAQAVDLIDICAPTESFANMPTWFKIEGSNDDSNWTLILERKYLSQWYGCEGRQYWVNNSTAYKYYKLTAIEVLNGTLRIARFRLYKKIDGRSVANKKIPALSSTTQDGYEATASSQYDGNHSPVFALDKNASTQWCTTDNTGVGAWIQIKFPAETLCTTLWMTARNDQWYTQMPSEFVILGSMDGTNFDAIKTITGQTWAQGEEKKFTFYNETAYLYYRVQAQAFSSNNSSGCFGLSLLNFGSETREYKRDLESYEYLVSSMSSNSQNGYVASAKSYYSNDYAPWKAFNRSNSGESDCWACSDADKTNSNKECSTWLQIQLPTAQVANRLNIVARDSLIEQAPSSFILKGSNDGETWTSLLTVTDQATYSSKNWTFENSTAYLYYKLEISKTNEANTNISIGQFDLINHSTTREY